MASSAILEPPTEIKIPTALERDAAMCKALRTEVIRELIEQVEPLHLDALALFFEQKARSARNKKTETLFSRS